MGPKDPLKENEQAKYPIFNVMSFSSICLGMKVDGVTRYAKIPIKAPSLMKLFQGGYTETNLTITQWKGLLPNPKIQGKCVRRQGINLKEADTIHLRLGITPNDDDCGITWSDSWIGIGKSKELWCSFDEGKEVFAGNEQCGATKHTFTSAIIYLFIQ